LGKQRIFQFSELGPESISEANRASKMVPVMKENNKKYCFKDFAFFGRITPRKKEKNKWDRLAT
jgi:hypothetical protein